jgi:pyruvate formate lyase activating enzyme
MRDLSSTHSLPPALHGEASGSRGIVFDVKRFALHDGPGVRTTVFLKGCPLRCSWCHNPESQAAQPEILFTQERCIGCGLCAAACPQKAIALDAGGAVTHRASCSGCGDCVSACPQGARSLAGVSCTVADLAAEIERDSLFFDESGGGVTLSGGEPLAQAAFAAHLLRRCHDSRIHTVVDTCGYGDEGALDLIAEQTDLFLYDIKLLDDERHIAATGASNRIILENLARVSHRGIPLWIRYPLIPGVNDLVSDLEQLGSFVAGLAHVEALQILPYHSAGKRKRDRLERSDRADGTKPPLAEALESAVEIVQRRLDIPVTIGG